MVRRCRGGRALGISASVALALLGEAPSGHAQPAPHAAVSSEAQDNFERGRTLFLEGRQAEAIGPLQRAHSLVPSPNTALLLARCLRSVGRRAEAAAWFDLTAREAQRRMAGGEPKYGEALRAAAAELALLTSALGRIEVRGEAASGTEVELGSQRVVARGGATPQLWTEPGEATVVVRAPGRPPAPRRIAVGAGEVATLDLREPVRPVTAPTPDSETDEAKGSWMTTAALVSGGVGALGLTAFVGFGVSARSTYEELSAECGGSCGSSQRARADAGMRDQTLANIGLGVGIAGAALGIVLWALAPDDQPRTTALAF